MNTSDISGIDIFLAIEREGSLSAAARFLGVGAPAVSHRLRSFERKLGVDLFVRTTRSIELTEAGRALFDRAGPAFQELSAAVEDAREVGRATTGSLRLTLPWSAYTVALAPVLGEFLRQYPNIRLELSIDEGLVDAVRAGFHGGFRLGDRLTDGMVAVRLTGPIASCYIATPAYLDANGRPDHPRDLLTHQCIRYKFVTSNRIWDWRFVEDGQIKTVDPPSMLVVDNMDTVRHAVRDGLGVGWSMRAVVAREVADGVLETVLDDYTESLPPFYFYYPEQNKRLETLRIFVDFLSARRLSFLA